MFHVKHPALGGSGGAAKRSRTLRIAAFRQDPRRTVDAMGERIFHVKHPREGGEGPPYLAKVPLAPWQVMPMARMEQYERYLQRPQARLRFLWEGS